MTLAFGTTAMMLVSLLAILLLPRLQGVSPRLRAMLGRAHRRPQLELLEHYDPGRELRAEQRARALLRSCVNEEEWAMYRELGFLRVPSAIEDHGYAYLIYPHKPILAYGPGADAVLGEYCIEFPDNTRPYGSARLPDSDDVLAKWIALTADERALIEQANMHLPGRQIRLAKARRDLARLARWEHERLAFHSRATRRVGSVSAR
jgi:hypothetical protein